MSERLGPPLGAPLFDRLALIGIGLIGSSIARAARRKNVARVIAIADESTQARERAVALELGDEVVADAADAAAGADLVILCVPVGADEAVARAIAPQLKAGAIVSDVGSVKGAVIAAVGPHLPKGVRSGARPPGRRHRAVGPGRGLRDPVRQPLVHPHAGRGRRPGGGGESARVLGGARLQRRDDERRPPRPGAGDHQPCAASDRLQHRRHRLRSRGGDAFGGDQVLRRRLPRLHPHRRLRSDDVARRVPQQQAGGARGARPLQRGSDRAAADDPLRRRRRAVRAVRPHPRDPPRHRRNGSGDRRPRLRPPLTTRTATGEAEAGGRSRSLCRFRPRARRSRARRQGQSPLRGGAVTRRAAAKRRSRAAA